MAWTRPRAIARSYFAASDGAHPSCNPMRGAHREHNIAGTKNMSLKSGHSRESLVSTAARRTLLAAAIAAGAAMPTTVALAQEAPKATDQPLEEVVVTGSILRRTDAETPS